MPKPSFKSIAEKADLTVADLVSNGGYLQEEQVKRFLQMVQNEPTILKEARRVGMVSHTREVDKIGFASRILRAAPASGTYMKAEDRAKVTTGKIEMVTKKIMAEVHIDYETLEDNIEGAGLEATIMSQMAARSAIDLEEYFLLADTASSDPYLALEDGILKRATGHIVDAGGAEISKEVFKQAVKALPPKYFRNRSAFRHFCSHANETEYADTLANRQGPRADSLVEGNSPVYAYGVPVVPCALMPETKTLLTHPQNLLWGVQRDILIETDKDIRAQVYIIVMTLRVAIQIEETDAVVLVNNVANQSA